jgi:hypothetical protein
MTRLNEALLINKVSAPVLWHTDLHMGDIYVSEENPANIVSLIDWQSIAVSPLFLQARFPEFLPVEEKYVLGTTDLPKLPQNYSEMDVSDKEYADHKLKEAKLAKVYELSSASKNNQAYKALHVPSFLRELFIWCGEVSEEGMIPLQACLIELSKAWNNLGFAGQCPVIFSEDDLKRHEQQFQEYRDYHGIYELARKILGTDSEGWISPQLDFAANNGRTRSCSESLCAGVLSLTNLQRRFGGFGRIWNVHRLSITSPIQSKCLEHTIDGSSQDPVISRHRVTSALAKSSLSPKTQPTFSSPLALWHFPISSSLIHEPREHQHTRQK